MRRTFKQAKGELCTQHRLDGLVYELDVDSSGFDLVWDTIS